MAASLNASKAFGCCGSENDGDGGRSWRKGCAAGKRAGEARMAVVAGGGGVGGGRAAAVTGGDGDGAGGARGDWWLIEATTPSCVTFAATWAALPPAKAKPGELTLTSAVARATVGGTPLGATVARGVRSGGGLRLRRWRRGFAPAEGGRMVHRGARRRGGSVAVAAV